jgi:hypothetical protein
MHLTTSMSLHDEPARELWESSPPIAVDSSDEKKQIDLQPASCSCPRGSWRKLTAAWWEDGRPGSRGVRSLRALAAACRRVPPIHRGQVGVKSPQVCVELTELSAHDGIIIVCIKRAERLVKDPMKVTSKWKSELNAIPSIPPGIKQGANVALTGFGVGVGLGRDLRRAYERYA